MNNLPHDNQTVELRQSIQPSRSIKQDERPDIPMLLGGQIFWSMYDDHDRLFWVPSEHQGLQELPTAQELENIHQIDRKRLNVFKAERRSTERAELCTFADASAQEHDALAQEKNEKGQSQIRSAPSSREERGELHPRTMRVFLEDRWIIDTRIEPIEPSSTLSQGKPLGGDDIVTQIVGRGRPITSNQPAKSPPFSLRSAPELEMILTDTDQLNQNPSLSSSDQRIVDHLFGRPSFEQLDFAVKWGWSCIDIERDPSRMTYSKAVRQKWCSSDEVCALKARFARFSYYKSRITHAAYLQLEELEKTFTDDYQDLKDKLEDKDKREREKARIRQQRHRDKLPEGVRAQIRRKDREEYRLKKLSPFERDGKKCQFLY